MHTDAIKGNSIGLVSASFGERILALMQREMRTRFSGGSLGYTWAFLTPAGWIAFVVAAFYFLGRLPPIAVSPELFVATGILPYILFRQTITSAMRALLANRMMIYASSVRVADILLAASLMELLNAFIISVLLFGSIILLFDGAFPVDPLKVCWGLLLAWFLGAGFGRLSAILSRMSDTYGRLVPILLRPMFWLSGIFFTATELPGSSLELFYYSPLFHAIEIIREGFFLGYTSPLSDPLVPLVFGAVFFSASFVLERYWKATDKRKGVL